MIELLIAMGTMTVVTGAAFALIGSSLRFTNATFHLTDAEQSLRTAHEFINRDLITAGDGLKGIGTIQVPKTFVQNYLTQTPIVDPNSPNYVNLALVTSDDNVPAGTSVLGSNPAATVLAGNDRITILTQDTSFTPISLLANKITAAGSNTLLVLTAGDMGRVQVGEIYALASQNSAAFGVVTGTAGTTVTLSNGDLYGINQTGTGTPIDVVSQAGTQPASLMRIQIIHYFVNSDNLLIRRVFGVKGAGFVDSVIAEHVTNFQFRYLLNLADPNGFVMQPVRQLSSSQQQVAVRQVETTVAVETVRAVNAVTANNNGRQTVSSTTGTTVRNLQFRQALSP